MSIALPRFSGEDGHSKVWNRPFDDPDFARLADSGLTAMALRSVANEIEERGLSKALPPLLRRAARQLDESGTTNNNAREAR